MNLFSIIFCKDISLIIIRPLFSRGVMSRYKLRSVLELDQLDSSLRRPQVRGYIPNFEHS